jgi:hypothetical protein
MFNSSNRTKITIEKSTPASMKLIRLMKRTMFESSRFRGKSKGSLLIRTHQNATCTTSTQIVMTARSAPVAAGWPNSRCR